MLLADLREIIAADESAQVKLIYDGRTIIGTKGNLTAGTIFDRDGGGLNTNYDIAATFIASDFPTPPIGDEIVTLDGQQLRLMKPSFDDYNVACLITFTSVVTQ